MKYQIFALFFGMVASPVMGQVIEQLESAVRRSLENQSDLSLVEDVKRANTLTWLKDQISRDQAVDFKWMYSHWYGRTVNQLLARLKDKAIPSEMAASSIRTLYKLSYFVNPNDVSIFDFWRSRLTNDASTQLILDRLLLDSRLPDAPELLPYEKIAQFTRVIDTWPESYRNFPYQRLNNGSLIYRGIELRSGDVIVADLANDYDGALEALQNELPIFTHTSIFVDLVHPDFPNRRFPAVFEIHKNGSRLVPLAAWLSPRFVFTAKILRLPQSTQEVDLSVAMSRTIHRLPPFAYDWRGRDASPELLTDAVNERTCSALVFTLLQLLGFQFEFPKTGLSESAFKNFKLLEMPTGLHAYHTSSTTAYGMDLLTVGMVDNNRFNDNFSRFLSVGHRDLPGTTGHAMQNMDIDLSQLPLKFSGLKRVIKIAQSKNRTIRRVTVGGVMHLDADSFPQTASASAIAYWLISNELIAKSTDSLRHDPRFLSMVDACTSAFRSSEQWTDPSISSLVREHQEKTGTLRWYKKID